MVRWLPLVALTGCMTFSRIHGAKTLAPRQIEAGVALGVRTSDDPSFQAYPIPQGPVVLRVGVVEDLDLGFRLYLLGGGADLRWRFFHRGPWHVALNPGVGVVLQPNLLNLAELGAVETSLPLLAELELTDWLSVSAGVQAVYRNRLNLALHGAVWRFDVYGGGGLRLEAHPGIAVFGLYGDVLTAPTRFTGAPTFAAGLDVKLRTRTAEQAAAHRARKAER